MEWLNKLIPRSEFAKNVFTLSAGAALAQVITFIFTALLARAYTPAHYGAFTIFISIVNILLVFATGKYDLAIVVAKNKNQVIELIRLSFIIIVSFALLLCLFLALSNLFSFNFYKKEEVSHYFYFLPFAVVFLSVTQVLWMWNVREKFFKILSIVRIIESFVVGFSALAMYKFGSKGLILSLLMGQLSTFLILLFFYKKMHASELTETKKLFSVKKIAQEYAIFPKTSILQGFVDIFQMSAIILVGAYVFNNEVLGFYAMAMRVLQAPMSLIIKPLSNVFFSEASYISKNGGDLYVLTKKTALKTLFLLTPVIIIIGLFGPILFSTFFGFKWREAGIYAQFFLPWIITDLVRSPISQVAYVMGQQKKMLLYTIVGSIILFFSIIVGGIYIKNIHYSFLMISLIQTVYTLFLIFLFLKITKNKII